jgi:hypothetical protein
MENALNAWYEIGRYLAIGIAGLGLGIVILYFLKLGSFKEKKQKYDYLSRYEIDRLWFGAVALIIAGVVYANTLFQEAEVLWLFVRLFVSVMFGLIFGVIAQNLLRFYYPFQVERRLKALRYSPRVNPNNGNVMKLLSEEEEDVHLDEGMQAEENVFSVDYDVWIDEATGFTKIEKYNGYLHAEQCPDCNYQTFKVKREELITAPTTNLDGELIKYYSCAYCGHKSKRAVKVAKLQEEVEARPFSVAASSEANTLANA